MEIRVIDRSTRKISLTATGRELYPLFSQMIDDLDSAITNIADHARLKKGVVRLAAPQLLSCTLIPQAIAAYRDEHPEIAMRLADCGVERVIARVLSGTVDFGVGPERAPAPQLAARELFEMPFVLVCPPGHPLAARERVGWKELAEYPFISLQGHFTERLLADMHALQRDLQLRPTIEVTFMTTALAMVSAGLGVTVCLPYAASLVELHGLVMRPLEEPQLTRRFFIYTKAQRSLSPAAESVIAFLFQVAGPAAREPARRAVP